MNKRYQIYKQNMLKQEFFWLDIVNMILGTAIIVITALALFGSGGVFLHSMVFLLGGFMMLLNTIKNLKKRSLLAVTFAIFTVLLFGIYAYVFYYYYYLGTK
ncbi:MAG: hypothetical protein K6D90_08720 [Lachnospiraceae bacterium]|nr:hypothetical protein [Lachnospiraceae bacterium]